MPTGQRCVAIFKWDGPLPDFDVDSDPERLTTLTAHAPAEAILSALRARGHRTNVAAPYSGEGGWHFTVEVEGRTFGVFTHWTGINDQNYFAAQVDLKRGVFAALFCRRVDDERLEPACRALDDALASVPRAIDLRWLTFAEFGKSYCHGEPLPLAQPARPGRTGG